MQTKSHRSGGPRLWCNYSTRPEKKSRETHKCHFVRILACLITFSLREPLWHFLTELSHVRPLYAMIESMLPPFHKKKMKKKGRKKNRICPVSTAQFTYIFHWLPGKPSARTNSQIQPDILNNFGKQQHVRPETRKVPEGHMTDSRCFSRALCTSSRPSTSMSARCKRGWW